MAATATGPSSSLVTPSTNFVASSTIQTSSALGGIAAASSATAQDSLTSTDLSPTPTSQTQLIYGVDVSTMLAGTSVAFVILISFLANAIFMILHCLRTRRQRRERLLLKQYFERRRAAKKQIPKDEERGLLGAADANSTEGLGAEQEDISVCGRSVLSEWERHSQRWTARDEEIGGIGMRGSMREREKYLLHPHPTRGITSDGSGIIIIPPPVIPPGMDREELKALRQEMDEYSKPEGINIDR
jgi:hypothetical protein